MEETPPPLPLPSSSPSLPQRLVPRTRDRIVVIGRRRSGKTIFLARLYESLWQGCTLVDGRVLAANEKPGNGLITKMVCKAQSGSAHTQLMNIAQELRAGRWPAGTHANSYAELKITHNGAEHLLTALDYPGEVFRKAFMSDSDDPDAAELLEAIDRAIAVIFLIDPAVVAAGGHEADEDTFGLTQAADRIRSSLEGMSVPIAVVFTKCDTNSALLREAGGVRAFAHKHFQQMFRSVDRTSVFACAAVRVTQNALGKVVPRTDRAPENVVEPLRYCLEMLEAGADRRRIYEAKVSTQQARAEAKEALRVEDRRSSTSWVVFGISVAMLFAVVAVATVVVMNGGK